MCTFKIKKIKSIYSHRVRNWILKNSIHFSEILPFITKIFPDCNKAARNFACYVQKLIKLRKIVKRIKGFKAKNFYFDKNCIFFQIVNDIKIDENQQTAL